MDCAVAKDVGGRGCEAGLAFWGTPLRHVFGLPPPLAGEDEWNSNQRP